VAGVYVQRTFKKNIYTYTTCMFIHSDAPPNTHTHIHILIVIMIIIFFRARLGAYFIKQEEFLEHTKED